MWSKRLLSIDLESFPEEWRIRSTKAITPDWSKCPVLVVLPAQRALLAYAITTANRAKHREEFMTNKTSWETILGLAAQGEVEITCDVS